MALSLTANAETKIKTPLGTEPLFILKISWASGVKYYSEKPYTFDGNVCEDTILKKESLQSQSKEGSVGEISSLNIVLDDTNGDLKNRINTDIIEGTLVTAYHHYDDLTAADATVILAGKITGPIDWLEGDRTFSFDIESFSGTGVGEVGFAPLEDTITDLLESAEGVPWPIVFGSPRLVPAKLVQRLDPTDEELLDDPEMTPHTLIYIVNLFPSSNISGIYAYRNCYGSDGYFKVPESYYNIDLNYSYGGKNVTAIFIPHQLSTIDDSGWSNDILVSLTSTLSTNTATQIKWILDTYSSLSTDATSFTSVANKVSNLPSHWALFDQPDALAIAEDMAWQARCALYVKNDTVYIKYLAEFIGTDSGISMNDAKLKSLELTFTKTEDIVTKFKSQYVTDYSGLKESDKEYIYTRNTDKFGVVSEDYNFFIYTNLECIKAASRFWGYRYSTSWRQVRVVTFLTNLALEAYDWVNFNLPIFSTYVLPAYVLVSDRDTDDHEITFELEIASSAGKHINNQPSLDSGYYDSTGSIPSIGLPESSITLLTICEPVIDLETIQRITSSDDSQAGCINIRGTASRYEAVEIVGYNKDGYTLVDTPSADNLPPEKILFLKEHTHNLEGCGYSAASEPQWVYENLTAGDPNWGSGFIKIGDSVGTVKGSRSLSKAMSGFTVVGIEGEIAVTNSQVEAPLILKSDIYIPAFSILELLTPTEGSRAFAVQQPSENNIPPGRLVINISPIEAGGTSYGYNSFDISPFVDGDADPENPNCEMGTKAGSFGLHYKDDNGNPLNGFIRLLGEGGKHQVRPF